MKKLLTILGALALLVSASAQNFESQSFLTVQSIALTNTICPTNTLSPTGLGTNVTGLLWTNLAGTRVIVGASTSTNAITGAITTNGLNANLFNTLQLNPNRLGSFPQLIYATTSGTNDTLQWVPSAFNLSIRVKGAGANANSAATLIFAPVCDGANENTASADLWKVPITANGTALVTLSTNVPAYLWMGCKALRLREVTYADTDAASRLDLLSVTLNSWVP